MLSLNLIGIKQNPSPEPSQNVEFLLQMPYLVHSYNINFINETKYYKKSQSPNIKIIIIYFMSSL